MTEVLVAGGGPAGAAVAAVLASAGREVVVAERCSFPRPHVGESLSFGVWAVLEALGIEAPEGVAVREARVRWRAPEEERMPVRRGLTVDRGALDALLLSHARICGAQLRQGPVRWPRRGDSWTLQVGDERVHARFLVDATGRRRLLGGPRRHTGPRTVAVHALWTPGAVSGDGAQTRIDAVTDGWLWGAHLPGGGFRVIGFADPDALRAVGGDAGRMLDRLLSDSPVFADLRGRSTRERAIACDATSYTSEHPIDATSVKVGEAAFAIDPLSSCGVSTAIQTGLAAAAAITTIIDGGDADAALAFYTDHQEHAAARHAATAAALYAEHREHAEHPFWRRRAAAGVSTARAGTPLSSLLGRHVRLATGATLASTPCLVGDRIERRRALTHPSLDRPVAFLGGAPLAPLLDDLGPTLAAAMRRWDRELPPGRAYAITAWLAGHGLLEPVPGDPAAARTVRS